MGYNTNPEMQHVGLYMHRTKVKKIDVAKGYYTKSKWIEKLIDEELAKLEQNNMLKPVPVFSAYGERGNDIK
jgi:hypothetical protein